MSIMAKDRGIPHYFPACVIGGFGEPARGSKASNARESRVSVHMLAKPEQMLSRVRASKIAAAWEEYTITKPPPGLSPNFIDKLWDSYETQLRPAISALECGGHTREQWGHVLDHVHAQSVRSPDFLTKATAYLTRLGMDKLTRDQLQFERIRTLVNTPKIMASSRFALLRRPVDGHRFIVNDKGYAAPLLDPEFDCPNVIFPLSPQLAVLMVVGTAKSGDDYKAGPMRDLTMTASAVDLVNAASWMLGGITCVMGHPKDESRMASLDKVKPLVSPILGPYRGTYDVGFCDWAVMDTSATRLTVFQINGSWVGAGS